MEKIFFLCRRADKLQSKLAVRKSKSLRVLFHKTLLRIKNKIKDCHARLAFFLCKNYRAILIPEFNVQRMIRRGDRKFNRKTARSMCTWSHFNFRQTLLQKAQLFPWVKVAIVNEAYTSKTCGHCGHINQKLGGKKTFICSSCTHSSDRDIHAARNILLRYITREIGVAPKHT